MQVRMVPMGLIEELEPLFALGAGILGCLAALIRVRSDHRLRTTLEELISQLRRDKSGR